MKRFYSVANVYKGIGKLQKARPNSFIGGDVIVGFPGETDLLFKETKKNLENLKFTKLHVFPFSRRPGTEAYNYSDKVPERVWIYL